MAHSVVKPQTIVDTGIGILQKELLLPKLFRRDSLDKYKDLASDTITIKVPGILPGRDYAFRNDRSSPIVFDEVTETSVTLTLSGNAYNAVYLTDENRDFDSLLASSIVDTQARGVAQKLNHACSDAVEAQTYPVNLFDVDAGWKAALIEARRCLKMLGNQGEFILVVGSSVEASLLADSSLNLAQNAGDAVADSAIRNAILGKRLGFTIVADYTISPGKAYALAEDAFVLGTSVPSTPTNVTGARTSSDGIALRWIRDYDMNYLRERSVVNTYYGISAVTDLIRYWNGAANPKTEVLGNTKYFVRGVKMDMAAGTNTYPSGGLGTATGLTGP